MTAEARGWGAAPVERSQVAQPRAPESGATFPGGAHEQLLRLANTLLAATEARGYHCVVGWCWGYAPRRIRGGNAWSNHAWALALDINAPTNPMTDRLITDMPAWMPRMWEDCGFRWGGRYRTRPDAMHYEYMGRPQDVVGHLAKAQDYLAANPTPAPTPEEDELPDLSPEAQKALERMHKSGALGDLAQMHADAFVKHEATPTSFGWMLQAVRAMRSAAPDAVRGRPELLGSYIARGAAQGARLREITNELGTTIRGVVTSTYQLIQDHRKEQ